MEDYVLVIILGGVVGNWISIIVLAYEFFKFKKELDEVLKE